MFNNSTPSLSDIAAVTNNDGLGNSGAWWVIILLFALFGGFNGGWGNNGNNGGAQAGFYATQADLQRGFDQAAMMQAIQRSVQDPGYMISNSFAEAALDRCNHQSALMAQINNNAMLQMQGNNATQNLVATTANQTQSDMCNYANNMQANFAQVRYDMATDACAINTNLDKAVQTIIQNDNANYRQLHDEITANRFADLQFENQRLRTELQQERLAASQLAQTDSIVAQLRPSPVPAYQVPNPWQGYFNNGCGCGCNFGN